MTIGNDASEFGLGIEDREALDAEARDDAAFWSKERAEFGEFRTAHKGQPGDEVQKALHKWLRHHGVDMGDQELTSHAEKIAAGEDVDLATLPKIARLSSGTGPAPEGK